MTTNTTTTQIIKTAADMLNQGEQPEVAIQTANTVMHNKKLIQKINALKQIAVLDAATKAYLYDIQLTDNALDIEPKVNAIFALVKAAKLIDDNDVEIDNSIPDTVNANNVKHVAAEVVNRMLL